MRAGPGGVGEAWDGVGTQAAGAGGATVVGTFINDSGVLIGCGTTGVRGVGRDTDTFKSDGIVVSVEGGGGGA